MAIIIEIKVVPQSGRLRCELDKTGNVKCYLKSPPEGGKANDELCSYVSKSLRVPKACVSIIMGATSRNKRIKIDMAVTKQQVYEALGIEVQLKV